MEHFGFPLETIFVFFGVIALSVYLDLFAHRNSKEINVKDAALWSIFWIGLALCFYVYLWLRFDVEWANLYLAGYVLEKSLSIDNLMVFVAIFASFGITGKLQHRILYWGIIGALIFRAVFVVIGTGLFAASPWVGFAFAAFVLWSGWKMLKSSGEENKEIEDYSHHWSVRWTSTLMPIYTKLSGERFFLRHEEMSAEQLDSTTRQGLRYVTPAFLCLMAIETSDLAFAFDSVPAVIAVTQEPLLVYAAMIFAILGLRSLYFILAALTQYLVHLEKAVIILLFFIGFKMGLQSWNHAIADTGFHISPNTSLVIVLGILAIGVIASLIFPKKE
ncbi:TerC/Alx family metal homeostasis membrane protein [Rodentibacter trehalosifermentans]|uniref:Tellurium resistance protein TerC n=1 Tax=Rodentibacter trehalosifermentans TaxID=1908263 RepID=A0A1V3ITQ3_9PAST|nr:TerC/Alx family metal homeostasis membrane protein [Rodentibacter trehalosifermentans]OOF45530.1 tellurium resistance protein TerC [Rodentibacter trehalosifermentans]OOF45652.1 tellurium resistance protein TerC [Rodentibacter trehalosifermentans]OOF52710.1 tellurium resistance protein TerC [Rodentibacter trehalosifermentans]